MSESAVSIRHLSKCYKLGTIGRHTLVDEVQFWWHKIQGRDPGQRFTKIGHTATEKRKIVAEHQGAQEFWALKDVSFDVRSGEVIGIIGSNGAGKSTLLKLLTRITEPTSGEAIINGRVGSLLEVGTGFHPELTGRENVYMNGTILGMKKWEISAKFDEIVAFTEIEKFIDTPVKRYSSGMYVRLAFAVAAHLEPEILLVDEVLAVGDIAFQVKCLGKMKSVAGEGRTVLFVSHSMPAVKRLCSRVALIDGGRLIELGPAQEVTERYVRDMAGQVTQKDVTEEIGALPEDPAFELRRVDLRQNGVKVEQIVKNGLPLEVSIEYRVKQDLLGLRVYIEMFDDQELLLFRSLHDEDSDEVPRMQPGVYTSTVTIPSGILAPIPHILCIKSGIFSVRYTMPEEGLRIPLQVEQTSRYNRAYAGDPFAGRFALVLNWTRSVSSDHSE